MSITKNQVYKTLKPKLSSKLSPEQREAALEEIGRYVTTEVALTLGDGKSPVKGFGEFKKLTEEYADEEKGGDRNPNLELEGDMLGALEWRVEMDEVKVGIFKKDQAIKAYGHNTGMKGHPWLDGKAPVRKLIPDKDESFIKEIEDGIEMLVEEFNSQIEEEQGEEQATGTEGRSSSPRPGDNSINWLGDDDDEDDGWL